MQTETLAPAAPRAPAERLAAALRHARRAIANVIVEIPAVDVDNTRRAGSLFRGLEELGVTLGLSAGAIAAARADCCCAECGWSGPTPAVAICPTCGSRQVRRVA